MRFLKRLLRYPAVLASILNNCSRAFFFCRFTRFIMHFKSIQSPYTNITTGAGHGVLMCRGD